jgi:hypothetical protein
MSEPDNLDIELDLTNLSADDLEADGAPPVGKYHVRVEDVKRVSDASAYLKVRMLVLAGTNPAGVGRIFSERLYLTDTARKRLGSIAKRLHLLDDDSLGKRVTVNWGSLIGQQLIVEVVPHEFEGKNGKVKGTTLAWLGFWLLDDDRAKDVPRDQAALRQAGARPAAATKGRKANPTGGDWEGI